MADTRTPLIAALRRMGLRTLVRIGLDPGRALTNAQPTTKELNDGRAEQFACIRQRMVELAEDPSRHLVRVRGDRRVPAVAASDPLPDEPSARSKRYRFLTA